jgi:hypothetical protein
MRRTGLAHLSTHYSVRELLVEGYKSRKHCVQAWTLSGKLGTRADLIFG